ncbi:hybrid sensor histidine kinase/response regulator transcription factor [Fodinibius salsisoli]|uniref:histidine kinase n=1 Tax=Fodinibius salsisoli TaxID=2820877 RepID=A0ABT3PMH4_9BACT|nr:hybrid sensor histidine kinase/response regulator transcription factor [Fodinibius salsisoli]MCW9707145.1 response regulator [Fodinibius salsisoli]
MGTLLLVIGMLLGSFIPTPSADSSEYLVRNYTVADGLPVNSVNGIVQDNNGYLYFSTMDGLVRYDGYDFVSFNSSNSPGINNNRLVDMLKTKSGTIWMVGENGSLISYRQDQFKTYQPAPNSIGRELFLEESPDGEVWLGSNSGIALYNPSKDQFDYRQSSLISVEAFSIEPVTGKAMWLVNQQGLIYSADGKTQLVLAAADFPIPVESVTQLTIDKNDRLWILGNDGLFCLNPSVDQPKVIFHKEREKLEGLSIDAKENDEIFLSALSGFYNIDIEQQKLNKLPISVNTLPRNPPHIFQRESKESIFIGDDEVVIDGQAVFRTTEIQAGFLDREGSLWVVSRTEGVFQIRKSFIKNISSTLKHPVSNVYPIIQTADSTIWAASMRGGIFQFKDSTVTSLPPPEGMPSLGFTKALSKDTDGTVYAALGGRGLWKYFDEEWEEIGLSDRDIPYPKSIINAMYRDQSGRFLLGMIGFTRIREHNQDTFKVLRDAAGNKLKGARVIREDHKGTLYLGTNGDGLVLLPRNGTFNSIGQRDGLGSNYVRDIYPQSRDTVWVATEDKGLSRIIFSDSYEIQSMARVTSNDGLISNSLHRIIKGPFDYLWISSNGGIMRIAQDALNRFADGRSNSLPLISFNERDGMLNREANGGVQSAGILTAENKLWFPNQTGITVIDPDAASLKADLEAPEPIIERINVQDTVFVASTISEQLIPKGERNISFKFTAPNFANPDRLQFKYRLSGINQHWQTSNQGMEASYTNLDPGTYRFEVAAERINGNRSISSVSVTIPPFFYETKWFFLLIAIAAGALMYGGYRYRVGALKRRKNILQKQVNRQTQELKKAAEQKSRFFTGITHELKTPLSLILGPLDNLIEANGRLPASKNQYYLEMMQRNGNRLKNLINQILDVSKVNAEALKLKMQPADLEAFTMQIVGQFQSMLDEQKMSLEINESNLTEPVYIDAEAWERIIINLMSNAIKYSPEENKIVLSFHEKEQSVQIHLRDFGQGIAQHEQKQVFDYLYQAGDNAQAGGTGIGLFLVQELTERMGGSVELNSELGEGTEFIITLRKGTTHLQETTNIIHEPITIHKPNSDSQSSPASAINEEQPDIEDTKHILITEDNLDFRNYLQSVIAKKYRASVAQNGREALQLMDDLTPDLVISDIMMPKMNGFEFVEKVRSSTKFKQLPVIFLSAKNTDPDIEKGLSTGADIYLTKPIRSQTLLSQIAAVFRRENILAQDAQAAPAANESELEKEVREIIFRQLGNPNLNIGMIADALYQSRSKLYREWKKVSDFTLNEFIIKVRMDEARALIIEEQFSVQEAARAVGYTDANYFSTSFKNTFGKSPSEVS